jgi:hypothetical protein
MAKKRKLAAGVKKALSAAARFQTVVPGGSFATFNQVYKAADLGLLEPTGHGQYKLTDKGEKALKDGYFESLGDHQMSKENPTAKQLIEAALQDNGKLPSELIYDYCYGDAPRKISAPAVPGGRLHEETGGDVEPALNPGSPELDDTVDLGENELVLMVETPEQQTQVHELMKALATAQVKFKAKDVPGTNEVIFTWDGSQTEAMQNALDGLGVEIEADDDPEATYDYYEALDALIGAVADGNDAAAVLDDVQERMLAKGQNPLHGGGTKNKTSTANPHWAKGAADLQTQK